MFFFKLLDFLFSLKWKNLHRGKNILELVLYGILKTHCRSFPSIFPSFNRGILNGFFNLTITLYWFGCKNWLESECTAVAENNAIRWINNVDSPFLIPWSNFELLFSVFSYQLSDSLKLERTYHFSICTDELSRLNHCLCLRISEKLGSQKVEVVDQRLPLLHKEFEYLIIFP